MNATSLRFSFAALLALAAGAITPATVSAGECSTYVPVVTCRPVKLCTREIARRSFCRVECDPCGNAFTVHFVQVTFEDVFSDGSTRRFSRTSRA